MYNQSDGSIHSLTPQKEGLTWEEQNGFLEFLASVPGEVAKFNESNDFKLHYEVSLPDSIDAEKELNSKVGFVITRRDCVFPEKMYCIYTLFNNSSIQAFLGYYEMGKIETLMELEQLDNFQDGATATYEWLRSLIKASTSQ